GAINGCNIPSPKSARKSTPAPCATYIPFLCCRRSATTCSRCCRTACWNTTPARAGPSCCARSGRPGWGGSTNWLKHATAGPGLRGLDGVLWVLTRSTLFKRERNEWEPVAVPALGAAQYFDVATEPNGVFWLATTEGMVRHAL